MSATRIFHILPLKHSLKLVCSSDLRITYVIVFLVTDKNRLGQQSYTHPRLIKYEVL